MKKTKETTAINDDQFINGLKKLLLLLVQHLADFCKGNKAQEQSFSDMEGMVKGAKSTEDLAEIRKVYRELVVRMDIGDQMIKSEKKKGLFSSLFKKEKPDEKRSETDSLIDENEEYIKDLVDTTAIFAKGALLMMDEEHPLNEPLSYIKQKKIDTFDSDEKIKLQKDIISFFYSKSNEANLVEKERKEFKEIISSLTEHIASLSMSSDEFNNKLNNYAKEINEAAELDQILLIKDKIIIETENIQKENMRIKENLQASEKKLQKTAERINKLEQELKKAQLDMMIDPLTKIYNRRAFDIRMKDQIGRFERYGEPFAILIFDLDFFKKVNDTLGHSAGDIVLKTIASLAKETIRTVDFLARYGGEEFVVIADKVEQKEAFKIAEKIRTTIDSHEFVFQKRDVPVTVSIGVADFKKNDSADKIVKKADDALYRAKDSGRNKTIVSE